MTKEESSRNYPDGPARRVTINFKQDVLAGTELVLDILIDGRIIEVKKGDTIMTSCLPAHPWSGLRAD